MAAPVPSLGAFGGLLALVSLATLKTIGTFLDLSTFIEGQVQCFLLPNATPPSAPTVFSFYKVTANKNPILVSSSTGTSITLGTTPASLGIFNNMSIGVQQAGGSKLGEVAAITGITGNVLTVSTLVNTYAANDLVYVLTQTPVWQIQPSSPTGTWVGSTPYSVEIFPGPAQWFVGVHNTDAGQAVMVAITVDDIIGIA
jgi:hypothetical protein